MKRFRVAGSGLKRSHTYIYMYMAHTCTKYRDMWATHVYLHECICISVRTQSYTYVYTCVPGCAHVHMWDMRYFPGWAVRTALLVPSNPLINPHSYMNPQKLLCCTLTSA